MDKSRLNRPKLVVTASPKGVETITIRVRPGERERGLLFLGQVLPAIQTLNLQSRLQLKEPPPILRGMERTRDDVRGEAPSMSTPEGLLLSSTQEGGC